VASNKGHLTLVNRQIEMTQCVEVAESAADPLKFNHG
jgi:hypothetical protein